MTLLLAARLPGSCPPQPWCQGNRFDDQSVHSTLNHDRAHDDKAQITDHSLMGEGHARSPRGVRLEVLARIKRTDHKSKATTILL